MNLKQVVLKKLFARRYARAHLHLLKWGVQLNARPCPLEIPEDAKCLCIAPHPDDETIGMGGTLARYAAQFSVVCLTSGERGVLHADATELAQTRREEFRRATALAGVRDARVLDLRDRKCIDGFDAFARLDLSAYDIVFIPGLEDAHRDHRAAAVLLARLLEERGYRSGLSIACYEVWSALGAPNRYVDIAAQAATKRAMLAQYAVSCSTRDYAGAALGINAYRGMTVETPFAEAFWAMSAAAFLDTMRAIYPTGDAACDKKI